MSSSSDHIYMIWNADFEYDFYLKIRELFTVPSDCDSMIIEILGVNEFRPIPIKNEAQYMEVFYDFNRRKIPYGVLLNHDGRRGHFVKGKYILVESDKAGRIVNLNEMDHKPVDPRIIREEYDQLLQMLRKQK